MVGEPVSSRGWTGNLWEAARSEDCHAGCLWAIGARSRAISFPAVQKTALTKDLLAVLNRESVIDCRGKGNKY